MVHFVDNRRVRVSPPHVRSLISISSNQVVAALISTGNSSCLKSRRSIGAGPPCCPLPVRKSPAVFSPFCAIVPRRSTFRQAEAAEISRSLEIRRVFPRSHHELVRVDKLLQIGPHLIRKRCRFYNLVGKEHFQDRRIAVRCLFAKIGQLVAGVVHVAFNPVCVLERLERG